MDYYQKELTTEQAAKKCFKTENRIRQLCKDKNKIFPNAHKIGRKWLIPQIDIDNYIKGTINHTESTILTKGKTTLLYNNWIDKYEKLTRKLPPLPQDLLPLALNYTAGQPISKGIRLILPSMQFWRNLLPSKREQLKQLVEWLGQDWGDYQEKMRRMAPPSGNQGMILIPKRKVKRVIQKINNNTWVELEP